MKIGEFIKQSRIEKGITQLKLAEAIGMSSSLIAKIEAGSRSITNSYIDGLSNILGVNKNDLESMIMVEEIINAFGGSPNFSRSIRVVSEGLNHKKNEK